MQLERNYTKKKHSLARVNADNSSKRAIFFFWITFFVCLIITFFSSNYTPTAFVIKNNRSQLAGTTNFNCTNPVEFADGLLSCQPFNSYNPKLGLLLKDLSSLNQFAQIQLLIIPKNLAEKQIIINEILQFEFVSLKRKTVDIEQQKKAIMFEKGEDIFEMKNFVFDSSEGLKTIEIDGLLIPGYEIQIGYFHNFTHHDNLLIITFQNKNSSFIDHYDFEARAILINPNYSKFVISIRLIFTILSIISFSFYYFKARNVVNKPWEQKVILILSFSLLLFNDPLYFLTVYSPNLVFLFLSSFYLTQFLLILIFSWIYCLEKMLQHVNVSVGISWFKKITLIIAAGIILVSFNYQISYYSFTQKPIVSAHMHFGKLYILSVSVVISLFAYILFLYSRILCHWQQMIWRNKLYISFNLYFLILLLIFFLFGWLNVYDESSQKLEIFYNSMNFYVIYLQFMYSVPRQERTHQLIEDYEHTQTSIMEIVTITKQNMIEVDIDKS